MGFHGCLCMVNRCGLWRFHKDRGTPTSKSWITLLKPMVTWGSSILGTYRTYIIWEKPWENNQLLRYDEIAMIQPKCCGQTFRSCHVENASWLSSSSVLFLGVSFRNGFRDSAKASLGCLVHMPCFSCKSMRIVFCCLYCTAWWTTSLAQIRHMFGRMENGIMFII